MPIWAECLIPVGVVVFAFVLFMFLGVDTTNQPIPEDIRGNIYEIAKSREGIVPGWVFKILFLAAGVITVHAVLRIVGIF